MFLGVTHEIASTNRRKAECAVATETSVPRKTYAPVSAFTLHAILQ